MRKRIIEYIILKIRNGVLKVNIVNVKDVKRLKQHELKGAHLVGDISLSEGSKIIDGVRIKADSPFVLGRYSSINGPNTDIVCKINEVKIGSFTSIARNVSIQEFNHRIDFPSTYFMSVNIFKDKSGIDIQSKGTIEIGNDVWIGTQCVILSGAKIGHGAIVAANSVVSGIIPAYAVVAGSPAKVLKYRFSEEIIQRLLEIQWWDWPIDRIKLNKHFFSNSLTAESLKTIKF